MEIRIVEYARTNRFLNMYESKIDSEGNLNETYLQDCRSKNISEESIDSQRLVFQTKYQSFKKLDEESPEQWETYTAYEAIFTADERTRLNPDASPRLDYVEKLEKEGNELALNVLGEESRRKMIDVEAFNRLVKYWEARGVNFSKREKERFEEQNRNAWRPLNEQEIQDMRNFEEMSSLTASIEPEDYYSITRRTDRFGAIDGVRDSINRNR